MLDETGPDYSHWTKASIAAIRKNQILIAIHGVHSIDNIDNILYGHCLLKPSSKGLYIEEARNVLSFIFPCDKAFVLDAHMLNLILNELESDANAVLSSNISTSSLDSDGNWLHIEKLLKERSHVTDRLILKITGNHPLNNILYVNRCLESARKFGCRVAIDDFGCNGVSPKQLLGMKIDIVTIDFLLRHGINSEKNNTFLHHLVELSANIAPIVVINNVRKREELAIARQTAATHVKGNLLSHPVDIYPSCMK